MEKIGIGLAGPDGRAQTPPISPGAMKEKIRIGEI